MLAFVPDGFEEPLRRSFHASNDGRIARDGSYDDVVLAHQRVLDAIRARDVSGAEQAMRAHLRQVDRDLRAVTRTMTGGDAP